MNLITDFSARTREKIGKEGERERERERESE